MSGVTADSNPKVSVAMITYAQRDVIAEAIESVLAQQTTFTVELVIGEDCSTDGTREIVIEYARRFPSRVRLLLQPENRGGVANFFDTFGACRGQYIAVLEGDDYWTSTRKLQKQVDFLDAHRDYAVCFHAATMKYPDGRPDERYPEPDFKATATIEDLIDDNFIPTCSSMIRRSALAGLPAWFTTLPWGDWTLFLLCSRHGFIAYLPEVMGVYRINPRGLWSRLRPVERLEAKIGFLRTMNGHLGEAYHAHFEASIAKFCGHLDLLRRDDGRPHDGLHTTMHDQTEHRSLDE
jgi:glycosyltransferase involved in cell wall biosynthesis